MREKLQHTIFVSLLKKHWQNMRSLYIKSTMGPVKRLLYTWNVVFVLHSRSIDYNAMSTDLIVSICFRALVLESNQVSCATWLYKDYSTHEVFNHIGRPRGYR